MVSFYEFVKTEILTSWCDAITNQMIIFDRYHLLILIGIYKLKADFLDALSLLKTPACLNDFFYFNCCFNF